MRECLAIDVDRRLCSDDLVHRLTEVFAEKGTPEHLCSDNGPEYHPRECTLLDDDALRPRDSSRDPPELVPLRRNAQLDERLPLLGDHGHLALATGWSPLVVGAAQSST